MSICRLALPLIAFASLPAIGLAHDGHGNQHDGNSLLHFLTSPLHVVPVLAAAILFAGMAFIFRKRSHRKTAQARR